MDILLFDDQLSSNFYPLTLTRNISDLRIGILTIKEKWKAFRKQYPSISSVNVYQEQTKQLNDATEYLFINSRYLPSSKEVKQIINIQSYSSFSNNGTKIAFKAQIKHFHLSQTNSKYITEELELPKDSMITQSWNLFEFNEKQIKNDIALLALSPSNLSDSNTLIGNEIYVEKGAKIEGAILNSKTGPIYVGGNAEIMEGSMVRGPFALCNNSTLKMGAKVYGATTIGPHSKVGGEVNNSIILGYSNKGHDGFLGNSVIGEWCNLGADTNNSNLKNNYSDVKIWSYSDKKFVNSNKKFLGLIMGDHSKTGINTMLNTGTVIGIFCNVFGGDFPEKFIPDFSWGSKEKWTEHDFSKAIETAKIVMKRRDVTLTENQINIYRSVFELTKKHKNTFLF